MARTKGSRGWGHIRRLPSGNLQASYIGPDGHRHTAPVTYSNTKLGKVRAEGWLADERSRIEGKEWTPPKERAAARAARAISLADYGTTWIAERRLKPRSRLLYESQFKNHIKDSLGRLEITAVTPERVRTWYAKLGTEHARRNSQVYGLLHSIMNTAITDKLVLVNPCQLTGAMNVQAKRTPVILTIPEMATLAATVPENLKALVLLKAWCAMRWSEVIELRRKDFDNDAEVVFIGRGATHRKDPKKPSESGCHVDTSKSVKPRTLVIPEHIRADVKHHLDVFVAKDAEALMFKPHKGGCHLNDRVFTDSYFNPALATLGRDGVKKPRPTIHHLRHFGGTMNARVGSLVENMARMGHSTVKASLIYQSVVSTRDAEMAAALSELATSGK